MKTLKDVLPFEFFTQFMETPAAKLLEYNVLEENQYIAHQLKYKNIYVWWLVSNSKKTYQVGWNESPSRGWSFPIKRII